MANAYFMLGAHALAAFDYDAASDYFNRFGEIARSSDLRELTILAEGYRVITDAAGRQREPRVLHAGTRPRSIPGNPAVRCGLLDRTVGYGLGNIRDGLTRWNVISIPAGMTSYACGRSVRPPRMCPLGTPPSNSAICASPYRFLGLNRARSSKASYLRFLSLSGSSCAALPASRSLRASSASLSEGIL